MILLQYGLPKSGSTFLTRLLVEATDSRGVSRQALLDRVYVGEFASKRGYWGGSLAGLAEMADMLGKDDILVVKTHSPLIRKVRDIIEAGKCVPFITFRHPGDAALSVYEAAMKEKEANEKSQFFRYDTHRKAVDFICDHARINTIPWMQAFPANTFRYEEFTVQAKSTKRRIEELIGLESGALEGVEGIEDLISGKKKVYNFNKGISGRYLDRFSDDDLEYLRSKSGDYFDLTGYDAVRSD